jgi:hypothetical protein
MSIPISQPCNGNRHRVSGARKAERNPRAIGQRRLAVVPGGEAQVCRRVAGIRSGDEAQQPCAPDEPRVQARDGQPIGACPLVRIEQRSAAGVRLVAAKVGKPDVDLVATRGSTASDGQHCTGCSTPSSPIGNAAADHPAVAPAASGVGTPNVGVGAVAPRSWFMAPGPAAPTTGAGRIARPAARRSADS